MTKFYTKAGLEKKWHSGRMTNEEYRQMERMKEQEEEEVRRQEDSAELMRLDWEAKQACEDEYPPFY